MKSKVSALLTAESPLTRPLWSYLNLGPLFDLSEVPAARKHFYVVSLLILFTLCAHTYQNSDGSAKSDDQAEAARMVQMAHHSAKLME